MGRLGGDYWHVGAEFVGDPVARGGSTAGSTGIGNGTTLHNSYLRSQTFQTGLGGTTTDLFGPGPDGPVATVRMRNLREGLREAEARIFIELPLLLISIPAGDARAARPRIPGADGILRQITADLMK